MKKLTTMLVCMLAVAMAMPVVPAMAQDEEASSPFVGGLTYARFRFNHFVQDLGVGDTSEFLDDDYDTTFTFKKGEVELWFEYEISDSTMGDDKETQADYESVIGGYGGRWTPEAWADHAFFLQVGDLGTGFGRNVNNDDDPRGSVEVAFKTGPASFVLGYGKVYEGDTDDDVEGDENLFRGQVHFPLGESGFTLGAYAAVYLLGDQILVEADEDAGTTEIKGDGTTFLGSLEMSGTAGIVDIYAETGFATGSVDELQGIDADEVDLSGFYALGGVSMPVSSVTLGLEAAFGTGDDPDTDDEREGFLGWNNDFGFDEIIEDEIADDGLSNKMYVKLSLGTSPTEKMDLNANLVYVAPVEDVEGVNGTVDSYGFEVNSDLNYQLAGNLKYVLMGAFASLEEDWQGESTAYQVMNRLEFKF